MEIGVHVLPTFTKDTTDRNRTSPFAFTGNKFEFRMLGSSINIACPNYVLNTIVAEELSQFADELEKAEDFTSAIDVYKRQLPDNPYKRRTFPTLPVQWYFLRIYKNPYAALLHRCCNMFPAPALLWPNFHERYSLLNRMT